MPAGFPVWSEVASWIIDVQAVVAHGKAVENVQVSVDTECAKVPIGEDKLANAGVVAAELAVPRPVEIVGANTEVKLRVARDA